MYAPKSNPRACFTPCTTVAVVSKDPKGKVQVLDQRKTDAGVGAVVGAIVGLVGDPVGVGLGAGTGGVVGYLTGNAIGIPREKMDSIKQSLTPDSSALVVVLNDRWVHDVERDMKQVQARQVIAHEIAGKRDTEIRACLVGRAIRPISQRP